MIFSDFIVPMLRDMIGDTADPDYEFTDIELIRKWLVGAYLVTLDANFLYPYAIDLVGLTISPDPIESSPPDNDFVKLASLKTACMMERADAMRLSKAGITRVMDNDLTIQVNDTGANKIKALSVNWCAAYTDALDNYLIAQIEEVSHRAVISPFRYSDGYYPVPRRQI